MKVKPYSLPLVDCPETAAGRPADDEMVPLSLYHHQAVILDEWDRHDTFLLVTKTGTGKTIAAVLPLLLRSCRTGEASRALAVYPTNELIRDQVRSMADLARRIGLRPCILSPETREQVSGSDIVLAHIDADSLEQWARVLRVRHKSDALKYLLEADRPCKIVLTNPDTLFLILAMTFNTEAVAALQAYKVLIMDEFHLYQGVELAHALFMIHLARQLGSFKRTILLTATPHPETLDTLRRVLSPRMVDAQSVSARRVIGERKAVHGVDIQSVPVGPNDDLVEKITEILCGLRPRLAELRRETPGGGYVPALAVVNSVIDAMLLEDRLVETGLFDRDELAVIRGLTSRAIRPNSQSGMGGKTLAIGTSAIEVGIDFECDFLIFEAGEAASFMQRFGRVARHRDGKALVLCPHRVHQEISGVGGEVDRAALEQRVYQWYPSLEARPWFASTLYGMVTIRAMGRSLLNRIRDDWRATPEQIEQAETFVDTALATYAQLLGAERENRRAGRRFKRAEGGLKEYKWIQSYSRINSFRTSMPSERVHDWSEFDRRGHNYDLARYKVDVTTLLRRAEGLKFNEKLWDSAKRGMLAVRGYGRYKRVHFKYAFDEDETGQIHAVADYPELMFYQEGHKTSVSHVMQFGTHVFVVLPRTVRRKLDWRLPIFECGDHIIAFDGAAILCIAIWEREQEDELARPGTIIGTSEHSELGS
jgi:hypothetical protein